ncbi:MAG: PTS IIA-like nitrogen regulatory protein PtsN [Gammaproteobacteria bacterium]|nr:PTS IIA-like nitrogen regulatory protein PtsN [Gammaproteobacteria bacterium]
MNITDLVSKDRITLGVDCASKKKALEYVSEVLSQDRQDVSSGEVFDCLIGRERLGSTGMGKGIAIPHCRLKGNNQTFAALIRLKDGIDYDSVDGEPVDLILAMVVPEDATEEHLQTLAQLAKMFSDASLVDRLHKATDSQSVYDILESGVAASQ